ncbi:3-hydroxyisobutyryl-CoA hydrolase-like protein 1, mitochondrial isoform X3 [Castanea sativa]|uniref:3-hydroxyisobutyryl-CoA hydrolase-like protein 1, mitochondrial isoform X3 n=1 Tax=Castanea sativa TaxID=21020 RepID=UPI003F651F19
MMQRFKAALLQRRNNLHIHSLRFLNQYHTRNLCSLPDTAITDEVDNQVLVEGKAWSRTAILNRPSVLNCLSTAMGARLQKLYTSWENNPDIGFVAMKGSGRAFCAGGDIVSLYHMINAGEYLGLTGQKLNGAEMISCGLATHYAHSSVKIVGPFLCFNHLCCLYKIVLPPFFPQKLALIEEQLGKLDTDDPSVIETSLEKYSDLVYLDNISVLHRIEILDKCFGHDTVEEIIDALESETSKTNDAWCISTLRRLKEASPLGLKVSLKSIREGRFQTLDQCLIREYRMSLQGISNQVSRDFCEGVRARMVDKDLAPKWNPPSLEQVSKDMVEHYFSPLSKSEPDLELPTELREAFT